MLLFGSLANKFADHWPRPTTGVLLAPCHDEFRGPRSDYVRQTLATIIKQRAEIEKASVECGEKSSETRKSLKASALSVLESELSERFNIVCAKIIVISGPLRKEKALHLVE
ncbi:hypothetical protein TNCV_2512671 [Trichonephila clavipes]|nr:hypothetical protein TNCV_2512671 [Trichonephila clavipes]